MLDLKAKLASAGLVSQQDIERVEKDKHRRKGAGPKQRRKGLRIEALRNKPKGEIYDAIRRLVGERRLDVPGQAPSENARAFHFSEVNGKIGRLMLEPELSKMLEDGKAAVVTYMSNHGLAHAVLPPDDARDVAALFPMWLRVLAGDDRAGQIERNP